LIFFFLLNLIHHQSSCWKLCSHGLNCKIHRIKRFCLIQRCFTVTTQSVSSSFFYPTPQINAEGNLKIKNLLSLDAVSFIISGFFFANEKILCVHILFC
jgi:hypothetical protein